MLSVSGVGSCGGNNEYNGLCPGNATIPESSNRGISRARVAQLTDAILTKGSNVVREISNSNESLSSFAKESINAVSKFLLDSLSSVLNKEWVTTLSSAVVDNPWQTIAIAAFLLGIWFSLAIL